MTAPTGGRAPRLTARESFVLQLIAGGYSVREIQAQLTDPPAKGTVLTGPGRHAAQTAIGQLRVKLGALTQAQLVDRAHLLGLLPPSGAPVAAAARDHADDSDGDDLQGLNERATFLPIAGNPDAKPAVRLPRAGGDGDGPLVFTYWRTHHHGRRTLSITVDTEDHPQDDVAVELSLNGAQVYQGEILAERAEIDPAETRAIATLLTDLCDVDALPPTLAGLHRRLGDCEDPDEPAGPAGRDEHEQTADEHHDTSRGGAA